MMSPFSDAGEALLRCYLLRCYRSPLCCSVSKQYEYWMSVEMRHRSAHRIVYCTSHCIASSSSTVGDLNSLQPRL
jgi:hypothetical protein